MADSKLMLEQADQDWQFGLLENSYILYLNLREHSWHAAFQAAWIESAFSPVDKVIFDYLQQFRESTPSTSLLLQKLNDRCLGVPSYSPLEGGVEAWDIAALRGKAESKDSTWWLSQAQRAECGGLLGVAMACWREAENLDPAYFFTSPPAMQQLPYEIDQHLQALRSTSEP